LISLDAAVTMSAMASEPSRTSVGEEPERTRNANRAAGAAAPDRESAEDRAAVILTPDQRVRVFISSTLQELAEERAAARRAIRRLHLAPVWYESGARPHPPRRMYRAYLEQSQVFVGIYWQRYGWVAPGMDISGLEDEYRLAAGKPMLLYLKRPAPDTEPRMKTFMDSIREAGTTSYRTFGTPRELERLLAEDLALLLSESFHGPAAGIGAPGRSPAGPDTPGEAELPAGTVTFLLTGIEGATRIWEKEPAATARAVVLHNETLQAVFERHGGTVFSTTGDGMAVAFPSAVAAASAAQKAQRALAAAPWPPETGALKVRMGLHTDEAAPRDGRYASLPVNRGARLMAVAHGGQIVMSEATAALVRSGLPDGALLTDLGEHRLPGLTGSIRIFQVTDPDLPQAFPPLRPRDGDAGNLPLQVSSFIGRGRELEQTAAALGEARVVTLTGVGGVGKTRLALQVAGQVAPRFADGAWLCELAPIREAAGVDDAVAAVFSVTARSGQSTREALVDFLRSKQLLLVLDNCEHQLADAAALAEVLERSCPRLAILATSREGLGIDGERLIPVPSLVTPRADADLETIADAEAVRLFAVRAAAVKPDFQVTEENATAVAAVVRRLDGVALAIELAAARVPAMTPGELARRLDRSFAVLAGGRRGAAERHQTLRAAIDWSFQLLAEPEQALLCRLAVFAGGCTLEAAEAVCGGEGIDHDAVFGLLASLVARSLVVAEDYGPESRYRLLETIRQYGEERLEEAGQTERWRARHAGYYADLLRGVRDHAHDRGDGVFWAVRLGAEQDNLLAAWSWAINTGNVGTAFSILAGFASSEVWSSYPLTLAGEAALGLPGAATHPGYPLALAVSAVFASNRADVAGAESLCRRAADANARRDTPDWRVEATVCAARSNIANTRGALAEAADFAEQAARLARAGGDLADASVELTIAVGGHVFAGDAPAAVPLAREALALARQIGAPALIATGLLAVGVAVADTDPGQARACLRESRELSAALGYQSAFDLARATSIAFLVGDLTGTLELGRRAIRGLQPSGDRLRMSMVLHMIAGALARIRPDAAAIIQGTAEAHVTESARTALSSPDPAGALGDERARELRARGADMDWDQAVVYALTQTTQALAEPGPESQT
jgi:predicted ATPase/class 3 adenylate cyclase